MSEAIRDKADINIDYADTMSSGRPNLKKLPKWVQRYELTDLPRLVIPPLKLTIERYLETIRPVVSDAEFKETEKKTLDFLKYDGPELDKELHELASKSKTSWLEGFWDTMYLEWRGPIPIHFNPCFVLQDDPTPVRNGQIQRAATLVAASLWFVDQIRKGQLTADMERDVRLCMHQFTRLFASTRIPGFGRDRIVTDYASKHIAVVCRDQYYWFDVYDSDGRPFENEILERLIGQVLQDAKKSAQDKKIPSLGMLTTTDREVWAQNYTTLIDAGPKNKEMLDKLNSALILLCLDEHMPSSLQETSKILLHADGRNRWFDKSIQLIVCANGKAGINMEHSAFDGHTCLRYAEDFFHYSVRTRCDSESSFSSFDAADATSGQVTHLVQKLDFTINDTLVAEIDKATVEYGKLVSTTYTHILHFTQYGKQFCVKNKVSPDGLVQMAYQLTYYKFTGTFGSTYESAMTKRFYHGRTECMRSLTNQAVRMVKCFADPGSTSLEQLKALRTATEYHTKKTNLAKNGEGVDRHLVGLLNLARIRQRSLPGYEIPEIFKDPAWSRMRYDSMSTSNCGGYSLSSFGFGPVVPDGFGLGYIIKDKCMHFNITSFIKGNAKKYSQLLEQSFDEMANLLVNGTPIHLTPKPKV